MSLHFRWCLNPVISALGQVLGHSIYCIYWEKKEDLIQCKLTMHSVVYQSFRAIFSIFIWSGQILYQTLSHVVFKFGDNVSSSNSFILYSKPRRDCSGMEWSRWTKLKTVVTMVKNSTSYPVFDCWKSCHMMFWVFLSQSFVKRL